MVFFTDEKIIFELEIRKMFKDGEKSLSVNRRRLKNALREETDGLLRTLTLRRIPRAELIICQQRLERARENLNDVRLDAEMSRTGLLHVYNRLKLFKKTFSTSDFANEANWIFTQVVQLYSRHFEEPLLLPLDTTTSGTPIDLQGAASLSAQSDAQGGNLITWSQASSIIGSNSALSDMEIPPIELLSIAGASVLV